MENGYCPHCQSRGQRYFETDIRAKHRSLQCLTCGHVTLYVGLEDGKTQTPLPHVCDRRLKVTAEPCTYDLPSERVCV